MAESDLKTHVLHIQVDAELAAAVHTAKAISGVNISWIVRNFLRERLVPKAKA